MHNQNKIIKTYINKDNQNKKEKKKKTKKTKNKLIKLSTKLTNFFLLKNYYKKKKMA